MATLDLIAELYQIIFEYCTELTTKLALMQACKHLYHNLYMDGLLCITVISKLNITSDILRQPKYQKIQYLGVGSCRQITDLSFLSNLTHLSCGLYGYPYGVTQETIQNLNLTYLDASNNSFITNVSHLTLLEELHMGRKCGIDPLTIYHLPINRLNISANHKTIDFSNLTMLKILIAHEMCGFSQYEIPQVTQLTELDISYNPNVHDVSILTNLCKLTINTNDYHRHKICGIIPLTIQNLKLVELDIGNNQHITDISMMTTLRKLYLGANHSIYQTSLVNLSLTELEMEWTDKITDVSFMTTLRKLHMKDFTIYRSSFEFDPHIRESLIFKLAPQVEVFFNYKRIHIDRANKKLYDVQTNYTITEV